MYLEAALEYLAAGWAVMPCRPRDKAPLLDTWVEFQTRLPTEEEVRAWWKKWPEANIAIITGRISGIVVVDVDIKNGGKPEGLPSTGCIARTGGGGWHYVYRRPPDIEKVNNQVNGPDHSDPKRQGRDVRADGGYIIVAPSVHETGKRYSWQSFKLGELGDPPKWSLHRWEEKHGETKDKWLAELIENGTRPGQRNDDTARVGGYIASIGMPLDVGLAFMRKWNAWQKTPLHADEVETTVRSVYKTEARRNPDRKKAAKRALFTTLTLNQFMMAYGGKEITWDVEGWMPTSTIAFLISPPEGYKSWLTYDLAVSIASGQPFLGKYPVSEPGPVLIVQQEDFNAQTAERNALIMMNRLNLGAPILEDDWLDVPVMPSDVQLPLYFHADRQLRFEDTEIMDSLEAFVREVRPKLVIIDPLYQATPIDDYMAKAVEHMSRLKNMRKDYGTSFLIVHHTKKEGNDSWDRTKLWGSQLLNAFGETTIHVRRPEGEAFTLANRHFKVDAMPPFVKLAWDIRMHDYHFSVGVEDVSKEEADRLLVGKGGNGSGDENPSRPRGLAKKILDVLAAATAPMSLSDIAFDCDADQTKVLHALQKLVEKGDVVEDEDGMWLHAVPNIG
jgi:hypothetical protein